MAAAAPATARAPRDPLEVRLDSLDPAVIPDRGRIEVTGTVTNRSQEEWTTVNLLAFSSSSPITDSPTLAAAAETDPAEPVGERVTVPGTFDTVETLPPGESRSFSLRLSRDDLVITGEAGVYWFGVHALGTSPEGRDDIAEGRARTFLPLVPSEAPPVPTSLVVPVRGSVQHLPDGRVSRARQWSRDLSEGGRLRDLVDAAVGGPAGSVTWLVDPAIPDAVAHLAAGNPERDLARDPEPGADGDLGTGAEADPGSSPDSPTPGDGEETEPTPFQERLAARAQTWLDDFATRLAGQEVLALPYGDLDVEAAADRDPRWLAQASARSQDVMAELGLSADPAIASRTGVLDAASIASTDPATTVLLSDTAFSTPPDAPRSLLRLLGHDVVLTSSGASAGGPGPEAAGAPLAVRQRLLSEAALRGLAGSRAPVVAVLPTEWEAAGSSDLFNGLDLPWLSSVSVGEVAAGRATGVSPSSLAYTEEDRSARLDPAVFSAANSLRDTSQLLAGVLSDPTTLPAQATDEALTALSYANRGRDQEATSATRGATGHLNALLGSIRVEAPSSVTLSSENGSLGATVINELDHPVVVAIEAMGDGSLELRDPELLRLAPDSRTRILLNVTAHRLGIHDVRLVVTDREGRPLGSSADLPIRAAQVSEVIWVIIAGGGALLFGAIVVRLFRRVRTARATRAARTAGRTPAGEEPVR
jgi:hypothetical protein